MSELVDWKILNDGVENNNLKNKYKHYTGIRPKIKKYGKKIYLQFLPLELDRW